MVVFSLTSFCGQARFLQKHSSRLLQTASLSGQYGPLELNLEDFTTCKSPQGAPVLVSHGLLGSLSNWSSMCKRISAEVNRKVFAIDLRNHGRSPHSDDMTLDLMSEDVVKCVREKLGGRVCLLGHSLGGRTFMWTALKNPELVEKLVVVDISPFNHETEV